MISAEKGKLNKHNKLARPNDIPEWAISGTDCNTIKLFAEEVIGALSKDYKVAYADAEHANEEGLNYPSARIRKGGFAEYTLNNSLNQLTFNKESADFSFREYFSKADIILINGNHFNGSAQILVIDKKKIESLRKKTSKLSNVELILIKEEVEIFDFLHEVIPNILSIPTFSLSDINNIIKFFKERLAANKPVINGLILAGGKSIRLGIDKTNIKWHNQNQRSYLFELLSEYCTKTFISESKESLNSEGFPIIVDSFTGLGPYGAILSAFREHPSVAWLVIACDLPLFDKKAVAYLIQQRNPAAIATAYESPRDGSPEPLAAIWEPKSYPILLSYLAKGYSCPRKVLIKSDVNLIKPILPESLKNVNTPEDFNEVKELIKNKVSESNGR